MDGSASFLLQAPEVASDELSRVIKGIELPENRFRELRETFNDLEKLLIGSLSDMIAEYRMPTGNIVEIYKSQIISANYEKYEKIADMKDIVEEFILFYLQMYLEGYIVKSPFSAFVIINEQITDFIVRFISQKLQHIGNMRLFEAMCSICGSTRFSFEKFSLLKERLKDRVILRFTISNTYGPSTPRYVYNDEYLGLISAVVGDCFPLLIYHLAGPNLLNFSDDSTEDQQKWANIIMIYTEIYLFKNHTMLVEFIKQHFVSKLQSKDDLFKDLLGEGSSKIATESLQDQMNYF